MRSPAPFAARAAVLILACCAMTAPTTSADAQEAAAAPARVPPQLLQFVPASHPEGLEDRDAVVVLEILVAVDGAVSDVRVVEGPGEGFDERALEAARQFRFEPARIGERAVAARIRYRYVFEARVIETVAVTEEGEGTAEGEGAEGTVAGEGSAEGEGRVEGDGTGGGDAEVPGDEPTIFRARAQVEPPPRDATRRELGRDVLTRMPGTRGDALRVVELLPGVGRPSFGGGVLIVRGAAPGDSQVFLDGNPVPLLYHFGGLTSFYSSQLLNRISFVPGNFSVRYGRKIGGILEVDPRDPRRDGFHGYVDVNLLDASLMLEGPIDRHFGFAVAFRRSYVDAVLAAVQQNIRTISFLTAPVYYDYQAIATWTPTDADRIRLLVYGSSDELRLLLANPSDGDFAVRGGFGISSQFHRGQVGWRHLEGWMEQEIQVGFGLNRTEFGIGEALRLRGNFLPFNARSEWRMQLGRQVRTIVGLDLQVTPLELTFRGPAAGQSEGSPSQGGSLGSNTVDFSSGPTVAYRPAAYVETDLTLAERLDLVLGVRADWYREIRRLTVNPRVTARLRLTDAVTLRGGVGIFSQPPEFQESAARLGNPDLGPIHALHGSVGGDLRLPEQGFSLTVDAFYKHIWDRVVATPRGQAPFFTNGGIGRIYGLEVGARLEPSGPLPVFGFLSYTLSRSERQDGPEQAWRLFDFDQTHILTLAGVWRIGDGWEAGGTFRLVSGNPFTPVTGAVQDVRTGSYQPLYGAINSDRNPFFHRLDVRVQKRWDVGDVGLTLYLDIQNVYNATNREGIVYSYDYSQTSDLPGLPILPSLGLRGEL